MYYQNYDDYMRDIFYFNQMPNQMQNPNMGFQNMGFNQQPNQINPMNSGMNYNNMFPSIYRIIQPVVSRVVTGNNYQYLTEDNLNSMVDTVYNIVEGDVINSQETEAQGIQPTSAQPTRNQSTNTTSTNNNSNSNTNNVSTSRNCETQNATILLKDLIKILILKEMICRNNMRRVSNNMMWQPNYQNCCEQRYMF